MKGIIINDINDIINGCIYIHIFILLINSFYTNALKFLVTVNAGIIIYFTLIYISKITVFHSQAGNSASVT